MKIFNHLFGNKTASGPEAQHDEPRHWPPDPETQHDEPQHWPSDPGTGHHGPDRERQQHHPDAAGERTQSDAGEAAPLLPPPDADAMTEPGTRPPEFEYLAALVRWRVRRSFGGAEKTTEPRPVMPDFFRWQLRVLPFIERNGRHLHGQGSTLTVAEATLLLLAIAPHVQPDLLDGALQSALRHTGEFPQLGGIRPDGHNFRGFLPTGETALFLLGDDDYRMRMEVRQLFDADHFFSRKKILWLEQLPPGEPVLSGKIIVSQDYIDSFVTGKPSSPHFGANFPAKRIEERRTRENSLVLNAELTRQVDDIRSWVDNNDTLLYRYGMEDRVKKGYRALFYGPPGTGKTLTAGILGNELNKAVYKIDISMVVSKYIGETEKNLELLFARAEDKGWILFFDEADALFGKRTDVRDAHDKYANQEVSYLLQRIEDYDGLIILATNKKNNIDDAFVRRFNAVLRFPFPDAHEREKIWKKSLPRNVRFARDVSADTSRGPDREALDPAKVLSFLRRYELSGANIMNVVHYASLKGAQRAASVNRPHDTDPVDGAQTVDGGHPLTLFLADLLGGIRKELGKENRPFVEIKGAEQLKAEPAAADDWPGQ
ncbi:MAG TPA: ATP-binding protein [Puia sp.]|nr:ATP-binding protein [Puia sp.]